MPNFVFVLTSLAEGRWVPEMPPRWSLAEAEADLEAATPASRPMRVARYRLTDQIIVRWPEKGAHHA